jgi:DNA-binding Lrp family transcriptional regulator
MITYILATCIPGNEKEVIQKIKELSNIVEVNGIMGKYDIFVKIQAPDVAKVDSTIGKVRSVPHVTSTVSIPAIYGQGGTIDSEKQSGL